MVINMIIAFTLSAVMAAIFTPLTIKLAKKIGVMDIPNDARKIQKEPMPRLGGLAFIMSFLISCLFVFATYEVNDNINLMGFFLGAAIVAMTGFIDDARGLKPWVKLLGQSLAAICVILSGVRIFYVEIPFLDLYGLNDIVSTIITFCWIVGVTNAFNLIDGLDGLATGVSAISTLSMLVIFILNGAGASVFILVSALLGGLIGFLPYNFNPAKTFMGDIGSNFLGFTLATVSMIGLAKTYTLMAIVLPVIILGLPIFDTLFAIGRRIAHHKPIMQADRGHLHHKLMDAGLSQRQVVMILYSVTAVLGIFAVVAFESNIWKAVALLLMLAILTVVGSKEIADKKKQREVNMPVRVKNENAKIRVMAIFGTRPEAIKMCPLVLKLKENKDIDTVVCVTAQHREMLDQVLEAFNVVPDYDLNIMQSRQTLTHITASVLEGLYPVIESEKPDIILVHGDTTTTFVAGLAAFYCKVRVGHVEAGLRTYDKYSPYPEEMNRKLVTQLADLYFAPTKNNKDNLLKEQISEDLIYITGNTVIDALSTTVKKDFVFEHPVLSKLDYSKKVIFMTAHRRENLGEPLRNICEAVKEIATKNKNIEVVYPVHLNPAVQEVAREILSDIPNVHLIEPLDVITTHNLINRSYMVLTDSGGIQEEAPSLGKPVLVLRTETERPEAVYAGTVKIVGTDKKKIIEEATKLLKDKNEYAKMSKATNPYGDGKSCDRIVDAILYYFNVTKERPKDL